MAGNGEREKEILIAVASKLVSAGAPAELFGSVMDAASGIVRPAQEETKAADEQWHQPGDYGMFRTSFPTAIVMFDGAETHLTEAAGALRELYAGTVPDFSSVKSIERSIKKLEGSLNAWHKKYGDDLVMQDTGLGYVGVSTVGEAYLAKRFGLTVGEAVGAIKALMNMKFVERRVYLTNDELPLCRLFIVDCRPQIETDPRFSLGYRVYKHPTGGNGAAKGVAKAA
ncbi:MAG: hypothetical protein HY516_04990 [Candidatus Aenigmarchaeota archaeon]|nr:hypothetical protein [Candidatus Aenigmarchaeota archaeon]